MATELKGIRIEIQTIKFLKKQANLEGRTFSGIVNKILKDFKDANNKNQKHSSARSQIHFLFGVDEVHQEQKQQSTN